MLRAYEYDSEYYKFAPSRSDTMFCTRRLSLGHFYHAYTLFLSQMDMNILVLVSRD